MRDPAHQSPHTVSRRSRSWSAPTERGGSAAASRHRCAARKNGRGSPARIRSANALQQEWPDRVGPIVGVRGAPLSGRLQHPRFRAIALRLRSVARDPAERAARHERRVESRRHRFFEGHHRRPARLRLHTGDSRDRAARRPAAACGSRLVATPGSRDRTRPSTSSSRACRRQARDEASDAARASPP